MRYAVISKGLSPVQLETEVKKVGASNLVKTRLVGQLFCEMDEEQSRTLARVSGLILKQLKEYKTGLKSLNESWLDTSQEGISELILSVMAWANNNEKKKISDNTKAGLVRARLEGKILGRHSLSCQCKKHKQTPPLIV